MSPRDQARTDAAFILRSGATALCPVADKPLVLRLRVPTRLIEGNQLTFYVWWPDRVLEFGEGGELVAETHIGEMMRQRPRSHLHLVRYTCGGPLRRRKATLSSGQEIVATWLLTGRVLVRDARNNRLLARSLPGRPFDLDPGFSAPLQPASGQEGGRS